MGIRQPKQPSGPMLRQNSARDRGIDGEPDVINAHLCECLVSIGSDQDANRMVDDRYRYRITTGTYLSTEFGEHSESARLGWRTTPQPAS